MEVEPTPPAVADGRRVYPDRVTVVNQLCRLLEDGASLTEACRHPMLPSKKTVRRWRTEARELHARVVIARWKGRHARRRKQGALYGDEVLDELLARIADGRGLAEVCAEPDMPNHVTVTRWIRLRPGFKAAYDVARDLQADRLFDMMWELARQATPGDLSLTRMKIELLKWRVGRLAPRRYGAWLRGAEAETAKGAAGAPAAVGPAEIRVLNAPVFRSVERMVDGKWVSQSWVKMWRRDPSGTGVVEAPALPGHKTPRGGTPWLWYPDAAFPEPVRPGDEHLVPAHCWEEPSEAAPAGSTAPA